MTFYSSIHASRGKHVVVFLKFLEFLYSGDE